jgi:hypothetical protein
MSNKVEVDLDVGTNETMRVEAYKAPVEGLALHRKVEYVPAKQEHKFTSKWQITHIATGQALLKPSECPSTLGQAKAISNKLGDIVWTEKSIPYPQGARRTLLEALQEFAEAEETNPTIEVRYVVRRNQDGPGYLVIDIETDKTVEVMVHRGMASAKAQELNEGVST